MNLSALGSGVSLTQPSPMMPSPRSEGSGFGNVIQQALEKITAPGQEAEQAIQSLAVGQTDNLHQVLLAVSQADLAFRLVLEIRNRLTEAYQEIQRMQV